jgi:hypothetical protein
MEVVSEFLRLRRDGKGEQAAGMLAENASVRCPWSRILSGDAARKLICDETSFVKRDYLDHTEKIEQIDANTFQRVYKFEIRDCERVTSPRYRETYFVSDGKIRLVTCHKQPARSFWKFWGI